MGLIFVEKTLEPVIFVEKTLEPTAAAAEGVLGAR